MTKANRHDRELALLGLRIAYYRKRRGLSQLDLAERAGLGRSFISKLEAPNVRTSVSLERLYDIAEVLDVPIVKLLDSED